MKAKKRFLSILLSPALVLGLMPGMSLTALATSPAYLTFTGTDSFTIKTNNGYKNWFGTLEYSTNASSWTEWDGINEISSDNNVLYLRGTGNSKISGEYNKQWNIITSGTVACSRDIRALLNYENPEAANMEEFCFGYLFLWLGKPDRGARAARCNAGNRMLRSYVLWLQVIDPSA